MRRVAGIRLYGLAVCSWPRLAGLALVVLGLAGCAEDAYGPALESPDSTASPVPIVAQPQDQPAWAVAYGDEFWRAPAPADALEASNTDEAPAFAVGEVIDRVNHAFQAETDGTLAVEAETYRARFDGRGVRLSPHRVVEAATPDVSLQLGAVSSPVSAIAAMPQIEADPDTEVSLHTARVQAGGHTWYAAHETPWAVTGNIAQTLLAPGLVEHHELRREGVEVTWILDAPSEGDLVIDAEISGLTYMTSTAHGHHYADPSGTPRLRVGMATAVDSAGRRWEAPSVAEGQRLRITVGSDVLAQATFPLAIDPLLSPEIAVDVPVNRPGVIDSNGVACAVDTCLVVWSATLFSQPTQVRAARIDGADGVVLDPFGLAVGPGSDASVAATGDAYYVAYVLDGDIYGTSVLADGTSAPGVLVGGQASDTDTDPDVACISDQCLVVWESVGADLDADVLGRLVEPESGDTLSDELLLSRTQPGDMFPAAGDQTDPAVAFALGEFRAVWADRGPIYDTITDHLKGFPLVGNQGLGSQVRVGPRDVDISGISVLNEVLTSGTNMRFFIFQGFNLLYLSPVQTYTELGVQWRSLAVEGFAFTLKANGFYSIGVVTDQTVGVFYNDSNYPTGNGFEPNQDSSFFIGFDAPASSSTFEDWKFALRLTEEEPGDIYSRTVAPTTGALGDVVRVADTRAAAQGDPDIAGGDDGFLTVWQDQGRALDSINSFEFQRVTTYLPANSGCGSVVQVRHAEPVQVERLAVFNDLAGPATISYQVCDHADHTCTTVASAFFSDDGTGASWKYSDPLPVPLELLPDRVYDILATSSAAATWTADSNLSIGNRLATQLSLGWPVVDADTGAVSHGSVGECGVRLLQPGDVWTRGFFSGGMFPIRIVNDRGGVDSAPAVVSDGPSFLAAWQFEPTPDSAGIRGARVNFAGIVFDSDADGHLISDSFNSQTEPVLAYNGDYLATWTDDRDPSAAIYGARIDSDFNLLPSPDGPQPPDESDESGYRLSFDLNSQVEPAVAVNDEGVSLVVWEDDRLGVPHVFGSRVDPGGEVLDPNGLPISADFLGGFDPAVASAGGEFVVVFGAPNGSANGIQGRRVNGEGELGRRWDIGDGDVRELAALAANGDDFLMVYQDNWEGGRPDGWDIRGQSFRLRGFTQTPAFGPDFGIHEGSGDQTNPSLAPLGEAFLVVYENAVSPANRDIQAQLVSTTEALGDPSTPGSSSRDESNPSVAANDSEYVVVFQSQSPTQGQDVAMARVSADNETVTPGPPLSLPGDQLDPDVAERPSDFVIAFADPEGVTGVRFFPTTNTLADLLPEGAPIAEQGSHPTLLEVDGQLLVAYQGVVASTSRIFARLITNEQPVVTNEGTITLLEDSGPITLDVLSNDFDPDDDPLTIVFAGNSVLGVATIGESSTDVIYTPNSHANGSDLVAYGVTDGNSTIFGTVVIEVLPVNDPPTIALGANPIVDEDSGSATIEGFATAITRGPADEISQALSLEVTAVNTALFAVQPAIDLVTGDLTFTPAANANGSTTVSVSLADDGGTANGGDDDVTVELTITVNSVNDAPSFTAGGNVSVLEDTGAHTTPWATGIGVGAGESESAAFVVSNDSNALFSSQPAISPTGTLSFTLAANAAGVAQVSVYLQDAGGTAHGGDDTSETAVFSISVQGINDAPTIAFGANPTVNEDASTVLVGWATLGAGAAEESGQVLSIEVTAANTGLFAEQPAIDLATGTLTFVPASNTFGTTTVAVHLADNGGTANGGDDDVDLSFSITVLSSNDPPSFSTFGEPYISPAVLEDSAAFTRHDWAFLILKGPSDEAGQSVSFVTSNNFNALFSTQPAVDQFGTLTFTPAPNRFGVAEVSVYLMDNGGTANGGDDTSEPLVITITVSNVNDPPTFTLGDDVTVDEDPGPQLLEGFATILNAGPFETSETPYVFIDSVTGWELFESLTLENGDLAFTPVANAYGSAEVTVSCIDLEGGENGGDFSAELQTFTITVDPVNDPPDAVDDVGWFMQQPIAIEMAVMWNDTTVEPGETLTITAVSDPAHGTTEIIGDGTLVLYTPDAGYFGEESYTYTISDGNGGTDTATVSFTVPWQNSNPTGANDEITILEDAEPVEIDVLANDTTAPDVDETLVITDVFPAAFGTTSVTANGTRVTYQPTADYNGPDAFLYIISDGQGGTAEGSVIVTITAVDDPLIAADDTLTVDEDSSGTLIDILANDTLGDGAYVLGLVVPGAPVPRPRYVWADGVAELLGDGLLFTPSADFNGTTSVDYVLRDRDLDRDTGTITFIVNPVDDLPVAVPDSAAVDAGSTVTTEVLANDTDVVDRPVVVSVSLPSIHGLATVNSDNTVAFTANTTFSGNTAYDYTVTDADGDTSSATVSVTVGPSVDLSIGVTHEGDFVVGEAGEYAVVVSNVGQAEAAQAIGIAFDVPEGLAFTSGEGDDWSCEAAENAVSCDYAAAIAGAGAAEELVLALDVAPEAFGSLDFVATVETANDVSTDNNTGTDPTEVLGSADLAVTKTDELESALVGDALTYSIEVTNLGPMALTELTLIEDLPSGLEDATFTASAGTWDEETDLWSGIELAVDGTLTLTLEAVIADDASGIISNTVEVAVPDGFVDADLENNSATDETTVEGATQCDDDGLSDAEEEVLDLDPCDDDTDGDGIDDGTEVNGQTDAVDPDSDDDGLCDGSGSVSGVCVAGEDSNDNGLVDGGESDPTAADSDGDGVCDGSVAVEGECAAPGGEGDDEGDAGEGDTGEGDTGEGDAGEDDAGDDSGNGGDDVADGGGDVSAPRETPSEGCCAQAGGGSAGDLASGLALLALVAIWRRRRRGRRAHPC